MNVIDSFRGEYFFLSNFYEAPVLYKGIMYNSNEAAFQAQKTNSAYAISRGEKPFSDERLLFTKLSPSEAKRLGRTVQLRPDWEDVKYDIMLEIVRCKFEQNPNLIHKLITTKDAKLIEGNTWGDRVWGQVDGKGNNLLGEILMDVRKELQMQMCYESIDNKEIGDE